MYYGNGKSLDSFFYLTVSTGIGGSIILNKKLFNGKISDIGAIGHSVIKYNGRVCGCGKRGCLEAYSSGNALIKRNKIKKCQNTKDLLTTFKNHLQTKELVNDQGIPIGSGNRQELDFYMRKYLYELQKIGEQNKTQRDAWKRNNPNKVVDPKEGDNFNFMFGNITPEQEEQGA